MKRTGGTVGIILGGFFIVVAILLIAWPKPGLVVPDPDLGGSGTGVHWITKRGCRICGIAGIVFGAGLICVSRWPAWGARRSAIDDYVWNLSQELLQHFGRKRFYDIEEVSQTARDSDFNMAYIAYAHAMFCSRVDFDAYYGPLRVRCTYDGLREVIGHRYFNGTYGFDAGSVVRFATPPNAEEYSFHEGAW